MPLSLTLALALTCGRKTEKIGGGKSESERKVKSGVQRGENLGHCTLKVPYLQQFARTDIRD